MSTRSAIIRKTEDGYEGIYCHWDGYLSHNGKLLYEYYQSPETVKELISLGDISILGKKVNPESEYHSFDFPEKDVTVAYARDRAEKSCEPKKGKTWGEVASKISNNGYIYVYEDGWYVWLRLEDGQPYLPLQEALERQEEE